MHQLTGPLTRMRFNLSNVPIPVIEQLLADIWAHSIEQDRFITDIQARHVTKFQRAPADETIERLSKRVVGAEKQINSLRVQLSRRSAPKKERQ